LKAVSRVPSLFKRPMKLRDLTIESGEASPDKNLVVVLHCNSSNRIICRSIKIGIERAVHGGKRAIKAATSARNGGERSSHQDLSVANLFANCENNAVGPWIGRLQSSIVIKNAIRLRAVPLMVVNSPPMTIRLSPKTSMARTIPFGVRIEGINAILANRERDVARSTKDHAAGSARRTYGCGKTQYFHLW